MKVLNSYILCQLIRNICEIKLQYLLQILYTYLDLKADFAAAEKDLLEGSCTFMNNGPELLLHSDWRASPVNIAGKRE